jgi:hypothetical protein
MIKQNFLATLPDKTRWRPYPAYSDTTLYKRKPNPSQSKRILLGGVGNPQGVFWNAMPAQKPACESTQKSSLFGGFRMTNPSSQSQQEGDRKAKSSDK